jgi:hypothetical protein
VKGEASLTGFQQVSAGKVGRARLQCIRSPRLPRAHEIEESDFHGTVIKPWSARRAGDGSFAGLVVRARAAPRQWGRYRRRWGGLPLSTRWRTSNAGTVNTAILEETFPGHLRSLGPCAFRRPGLGGSPVEPKEGRALDVLSLVNLASSPRSVFPSVLPHCYSSGSRFFRCLLARIAA